MDYRSYCIKIIHSLSLQFYVICYLIHSMSFYIINLFYYNSSFSNLIGCFHNFLFSLWIHISFLKIFYIYLIISIWTFQYQKYFVVCHFFRLTLMASFFLLGLKLWLRHHILFFLLSLSDLIFLCLYCPCLTQLLSHNY